MIKVRRMGFLSNFESMQGFTESFLFFASLKLILISDQNFNARCNRNGIYIFFLELSWKFQDLNTIDYFLCSKIFFIPFSHKLMPKSIH